MDGQQLYTTDSHIDNQGNIYTVGFNSNSTSDTTYSCIINKFSSQGLHQYSKKYFTGGGSVSPTITSDFERNIYVVGELNIRKLDHAGNLLLEFPHNSTNIKKIDVDSTENIYLFSVFTDNDNGKFGPIIRKFNPYGIELWDFVPFSLNLQNGENAILNDAILDLEGNSIITGSMFRSGERSIFTAHIDFNGLLIWENVFSLSGKTKISGNKLIKSDNGTVYVTGYCGREYYTNSYDALTLSISNEGNLAWYKTFDVNSDEDQAFDIKAFNSGVVISGISNVDEATPMFAVHYGVTGSEIWNYVDTGKKWRNSISFNNYPPISTSIITDYTELYISGALDYGGGNSAFHTIKLNQDGEKNGSLSFGGEFVGRLSNSFRWNDDILLICSDTDSVNAYDYVKLINYDMNLVTDISENNNQSPKNYFLSQNYPNPFNPSTIIEFAIPTSGNVSLKVFNSLGEKVAELASSEMNAGHHSINFDATNLSSGIYYYRISAGSFTQTNKMLLIK